MTCLSQKTNLVRDSFERLMEAGLYCSARTCAFFIQWPIDAELSLHPPLSIEIRDAYAEVFFWIHRTESRCEQLLRTLIVESGLDPYERAEAIGLCQRVINHVLFLCAPAFLNASDLHSVEYADGAIIFVKSKIELAADPTSWAEFYANRRFREREQMLNATPTELGPWTTVGELGRPTNSNPRWH